MSNEKRAAIPRPSICRAVVVHRRDGRPLFNTLTGDPPSALPATVVRVIAENALRIECCVHGATHPGGLMCADHATLNPAGPPDGLVWEWPPRT